MNTNLQPIAITGMGVTTALGAGCEANWKNLTHGISGVKAIERFSTQGLQTTIAATVDHFDHIDPIRKQRLGCVERTFLTAKETLEEALAQSRWQLQRPSRTRLFVGTSSAETEWYDRINAHRAIASGSPLANKERWDISAYRDMEADMADVLYQHSRSSFISEKLNDLCQLATPPITITTACASGGSAVQLAIDAIRSGELDAAIVIGAECKANIENIVRFSILSALSTANDNPQAASKPFDEKRDGFVMGEGAAAMILESYEHAQSRQANVIAEVLGCGNATDNFHKTRSHPSGKYIVKCMKNALANANIKPESVDHINAHGTSTPENDKMESLGINELFGDHTSNISVTSTKSMTGHTLCAAGMVEAVYSALSVINNEVPPTINLSNIDSQIQLNVVRGEAEKRKVNVALSNSFGFGGQNVSVIVGKV